MIISNRIPYEYFITTGKGESDAGSEGLPFETGSYDDALNYAGIQNANIIEYTSVIPTNAKIIRKEEGLRRIKWGQVIETIKAQTNGKKGEFISSAVITTDVYSPSGKYLGGFACEYSGSGSRKEAMDSLCISIRGMIQRRGYGIFNKTLQIKKKNISTKGYTIIPGKHFVYESMKVSKNAGTVFSAICFMSFTIYEMDTVKHNKTVKIKQNKLM